MPRALIIQHDVDGGPGLVRDRLEHHGFTFDEVQVMDGDGEPMPGLSFPDGTGYDFVVSLGSVKAVYDRATIGTWIDAEFECLRAAHAADIPTLGLCFGGQALSAALGGEVTKAPGHEIGWITLETSDPGLLPAGPWFAWHVDQFTLPPGATEVARTELCTHAFRLGRSVGLQFHPEVDEAMVKLWVESPSDDYFERHGVTRDEVVGGANYDGSRRALFALVDRMIEA